MDERKRLFIRLELRFGSRYCEAYTAFDVIYTENYIVVGPRLKFIDDDSGLTRTGTLLNNVLAGRAMHSAAAIEPSIVVVCQGYMRRYK